MSIQIITVTLKYSKIYNLAKGKTLVYQDSISARICLFVYRHPRVRVGSSGQCLDWILP